MACDMTDCYNHIHKYVSDKYPMIHGHNLYN